MKKPTRTVKKTVKFIQEKTEKGSRYTPWIFPIPDGYHMKCCDCGLVHTMKFRAVVYRNNKDGSFMQQELDKEFFRIKMKVSRNNKLTKEQRSLPSMRKAK